MKAADERAEAVLYQEARYLDEQRWDEWLALYAEDCEFWMPAWRSESEVTEDPKKELSLIYYASRAGLEDRVWRVRSGTSIASTPMPRTHHAITNVLAEPGSDLQLMRVRSNWTVQQFRPKQQEVLASFGRYEHELVCIQGAWRIRRKKIILLNDYLIAMLDFYCV